MEGLAVSDAIAEARALLAGALELAVDRVAADASMATIEAWDSLAHVRIIAALEARLGRQLAPEDAVAIAGVADIAALLARAAQ